MSTQTKNKTGILKQFLASFWNEETIEDNTNLADIKDIDEKTKKILMEADNNTDKKGKEVAKYIVSGEEIRREMSKAKYVINSKTEAAMRKYCEEINADKEKDRTSDDGNERE